MLNRVRSGFSRRKFLKSSVAFGAMTLAMPAIIRAADFKVPGGMPAPNGPLSWLDSGGKKMTGELIGRLLMVLVGFVLAMLGVIVFIHGEHYELGILISFGGVLSMFNGLPNWDQQ